MTESSRKIINRPQAAEWLSGGGEMGELIRSFDWSKTALGPIESWPQSLRSAVSILLPSKAQIAMFWGPDLITLYNDAYTPVLGKKHPQALGLPIREVWSELWTTGLRELFEGVLTTGEAFWASDRPFYMERYGFPEETFFDISYDPIRDESGKVGGLFCIVRDTTARVLSERRLRTLRDLSVSASSSARSVKDACGAVAAIVSGNGYDIPFALIYLLDQEAGNARLMGTSGLMAGSAAAPVNIDLSASNSETSGWPFKAVMSGPLEITDVIKRFGELPSGVWPEPPHTAMLIPIRASGQDGPAGFLIAGVSPRRPLDDQYRAFFDLLSSQIATTIANARAYEEERRRAEALAELDRAKTTFFSNVSHEFRTPLTLMLGPVSDMLTEMDGSLPSAERERLEIAHRNGLRLQKLVNTLLDFSRIEAGRVQASFEPVELGTFTTELASNFRSACEKAGLDFVVECPPLAEPVYVDADMWEKVVLNLISNAFKFTLSGRIAVTQRVAGDHIELVVSDTGVGIPAEHLPRLFERFHRVEDSRGRTQEGSGIGLALVRELVKLHGGSVTVQSTLGKGSAFTVCLPTGKAHLPADRVGAKRTMVSTALGAASFVGEALRWLPDSPDISADPERDALEDATLAREKTSDKRFHILLADDNADMRDYVRRLLGSRYEVRTVADGQAAWNAVQEQVPDLILSDVMMPLLDGFELLRRLRADSRTREVPVILLSARTGEESRIEGLEASADDYLTKPFSARELLARVDAHLRVLEIRRKGQEVLRASEERYRQLVGLLPVAVYTCDAPSGVITFHNQRAAELWGRTPKLGETDERFCGSFRLWRRDGSLLTHDQTPMAIALRSGQAFRNQDVIIERPDGSRIDVLVNIDPIFDAQGKIIGAINAFQDTTALKSTQEALRASELRYRQIFEQSIDGVFVATRDGRYVDVSPSGCEMLGMTREEVLSSTFNDVLVPEDIEHIPAAVAEFADGKVHHTEWRFKRKDGSVFIGEVSGRELPDGKLQGIVRDITERKRAEAALRESERRLASELEAMNRLHALTIRVMNAQNLTTALEDVLVNAVATCQADFGCIQLYDARTQELEMVTQHGFGDEFLDHFRIVRGDEGSACSQALKFGERIMIDDVNVDPAFAPHRQIAAAAGFRAVQSMPLKTHDLRIVGVLSTHFRIPHRISDRDQRMLDLYARLAADMIERFRIQQSLKEADRRKDEFLATLAHELRNPLAPICNGLQLIRLSASKEAQFEAIIIMERQLQQMVRLVDDLLDVARISRNKLELRKEPVDLESVVRSAVETSRPLIEALRHELEISLPAAPIMLEADPVRLAQAFSNLLNNAAKYSEQGSRISLTAEQQDGELIVNVRDTGIGIEADKLVRIFEMFVQGDGLEERSQGGLGVGLALVQRLIEMHGGRVEARSEGSGKGSEFILRLPLIVTAAPEVAHTKDEHLRPAMQLARRILVVDDNRDSAESMAMMLEIMGYDVAMAHDGLEAIGVARTFKPDVAFLDLGMPRLNGYEAARSIREQQWGKQIKLVALTGWGQEEVKRRTQEAGFDAHIVKPIDFNQLEELVADMDDGASPPAPV